MHHNTKTSVAFTITWIVIIFVSFSSIRTARAENTKDINGKSNTTATQSNLSGHVSGYFIISRDDSTIRGMTLVIQMYEYDPHNKTQSAQKIDNVDIKKVDHVRGKMTSQMFSIGDNVQIKPDHAYFVTAHAVLNGVTVYVGRPSFDPKGHVITQGKPRDISFTGIRESPL